MYNSESTMASIPPRKSVPCRLSLLSMLARRETRGLSTLGNTPALRAPRTKHILRPPPRSDLVINITHIMLRLAHIRKLGPPSPLRPTPHDLNARHVGRVDLVPHLDARLEEVVAQQDGGVDAGAADHEQHAGEGLAFCCGDLQDVAYARCAGMLGEEGGAGSGAVEAVLLLVVEGEKGGGVGFADGEGGLVDCKGVADWFVGDLGLDCVCGGEWLAFCFTVRGV